MFKRITKLISLYLVALLLVNLLYPATVYAADDKKAKENTVSRTFYVSDTASGIEGKSQFYEEVYDPDLDYWQSVPVGSEITVNEENDVCVSVASGGTFKIYLNGVQQQQEYDYGDGTIDYDPNYNTYNIEPVDDSKQEDAADFNSPYYSKDTTLKLFCSEVFDGGWLQTEWIVDVTRSPKNGNASSVFHVRYEANGGTGETISHKNMPLGSKINLSSGAGINNPGWKLTGWNTKEDGSGTSYALGEVTDFTKDGAAAPGDGEEVVLYAQWDATYYEVLFDANGAKNSYTGEEEDLSGYAQRGTDVENDKITWLPQLSPDYGIELPTQEGEPADFLGWSLTKDGAAQFVPITVVETRFGPEEYIKVSDTGVTLGKSVTLYARYGTKQDYKIEYHPNTGANTDQTHEEQLQGDTATVKKLSELGDYTKEGYTFGGWSTKQDAQAPDESYAPGTDLTFPITDVGDTLTLYAVWTKNHYTVVFEPNGGDGKMSEQPFIYDEEQSLNKNEYKKTGYTFKGWKHGNKTYLDQTIVKNLTAVDNERVTLEAIWEANQYTVEFDANGGDGKKMDAQQFSYDKEDKLSENTYTKKGYTFAGWSTKDDPNKVYDDQEIVKNLTADAGGTVTLYAVWKENPYTVVYEANGGTGEKMPDQKFVLDEEKELSKNTYTKTGYTFQGWAAQADGDVVHEDGKLVANIANPGETLTLYAKWKANPYKVTYEPNGGDGAKMADQEFAYDEKKNLSKNTYTRAGYTFQGWAAKADGKVVHADEAEVSNLTADANGTVTLYAVWEPNNYTVIYDSNGGTGSPMANQKFVYDVEQALNENTYTKDGYLFVGWSTAENGEKAYEDKEIVKNLTTEADGKVTLYAVWKENPYTVVFNSNGGEGQMDSQQFAFNETKGLRMNAYTKTGYTFQGWAASTTGTVAHKDGEEVTDIAKPGETVTLYAVWAANEYTVIYDANGGDGTKMPDQKFAYDEKKNLSKNTYTRVGYTFQGWATEQDGAVVYTDEQEVSNLTADANGTVTLYAVWAEKTYTVEYDVNGGEGSEDALTGVKKGDEISLSEGHNISYAEHHLVGWSTEQNATTADYTPGEKIVFPIDKQTDGKVTLYAVWEVTKKTYTVQYDANGGTGSAAEHTGVHEGEHITLSDGKQFSRDKHHLLGWSTNKDATEAEYKLGSEITLHIEHVKDGVLTLYAVWERIQEQYTIRYEANGGAGEAFEEVVEVGKDITLSTGEGFTKEGYQLAQWSTTARTVTYKLGEACKDIAKAGETITLYAQWDANQYSVIFDANGGEGSMEQQSFVYDVQQNLSKNLYTKAGYTFQGWATEQDGQVVYTDEEEVMNLTNENNGEVTLYAVWQPVSNAEDPSNPPQDGQENNKPSVEGANQDLNKPGSDNTDDQEIDSAQEEKPATENAGEVPTGEQTNGMLYMSALVSGLMMAVLLIKKKRR